MQNRPFVNGSLAVVWPKPDVQKLQLRACLRLVLLRERGLKFIKLCLPMQCKPFDDRSLKVVQQAHRLIFKLKKLADGCWLVTIVGRWAIFWKCLAPMMVQAFQCSTGRNIQTGQSHHTNIVFKGLHICTGDCLQWMALQQAITVSSLQSLHILRSSDQDHPFRNVVKGSDLLIMGGPLRLIMNNSYVYIGMQSSFLILWYVRSRDVTSIPWQSEFFVCRWSAPTSLSRD